MAIFLILAPYAVYTLLMMVSSALVSVVAAASICLATIALDLWYGRSVKMLAAGSALTFAAIGLYIGFVKPDLGALAVKISVDLGILAIALGSMLIGRPFTLQYAVESVPAEIAAIPGFLRANYVITAAWTGAALLMLAANLLLLYVPGLPIWTSLAIAFAARNSAVYFTKWYPEYQSAKYGCPKSALPTSN